MVAIQNLTTTQYSKMMFIVTVSKCSNYSNKHSYE